MSQRFYCLCLLYCLCLVAVSSKAKAKNIPLFDSIWNSRLLTEDLYLQVHQHWSPHPATKILLDILFLPPNTHPATHADICWSAYQGKVIGKVNFHSLGVFEPQKYKTPARRFWGHASNFLFPATRSWVIRHWLTFQSADMIDETQLKNSLKAIKSLPYIEQAKLNITPESADTVDVLVTTQDSLPIQLTINPEDEVVGLLHQNIAGLGHTWANYFSYNPPFRYSGLSYQIPSLFTSAIIGEINYLQMPQKQLKSVAIARPFKQQAGYIGAASVSYKGLRENRFLDGQANLAETFYSFHEQNAWLGYAWKTAESNKEGFFYGSGRIYHQAFVKRPPIDRATNKLFHNHTLLLGSWGFTQLSAHTRHLVYNLGRPEKIPEGVKYNFVGGYQIGEFWNRFYAGLDIVQAKSVSNGSYIASSLSMGGFLRNQTIEQGSIKLTANYFSPILQHQKYAIRQFIALNYLAGFNRFREEFLSTHHKSIIKQEADPFPPGRQRLNLHLETVGWPTRLIAGCQIATLGYLNAVALYKTRDNQNISQQSTFCESLGLGLRVGHERFAFGSCQIKIGYKPILQTMEFSISTSTNLSNQAWMISEPSTISYPYYE